MGYRSWYGGIKTDTDSKTFNKSWGIDTSKYLKDMKYPSKKVINKAISMTELNQAYKRYRAELIMKSDK